MTTNMRALALMLVLVSAPAQVVVARGEPVATAHHTWSVIGTSSAQARPALTSRRFLGLINDSSNVVYCTVDDTTAALNEGLRLNAAGTTGDRVFFLQNVPGGAINCIAASNGNRVLVIEGR